VSAERAAPALPLFGEKEKKEGPPSEESVLRHLAQTLSVPKTLKRFPALNARHLQEMLLRSAQRAEEKMAAAEAPRARKYLPEFFIQADGASRGNPGEAGMGAVIADARGRTIKELKHFLGMATNNVAEYRAVILALQKALDLGAGSVTLYLDSELVVRQLRGEYKVREAHLKPFHREALEILNRFSEYHIHHVPREENRRADQLANEAIDQKIKEIKV
jgi:ribonuclease HI